MSKRTSVVAKFPHLTFNILHGIRPVIQFGFCQFCLFRTHHRNLDLSFPGPFPEFGICEFCLPSSGSTLPLRPLRWPRDMHPNVDWPTDDEQYKLITDSKTPLEEVVIHLELNLGLHASELCNLRLDGINYRRRVVDVLGKGLGEGNWRSVPFVIDTEEILSK